MGAKGKPEIRLTNQYTSFILDEELPEDGWKLSKGKMYVGRRVWKDVRACMRVLWREYYPVQEV
jgi:hypothetical protein